MKLDAMLPIAAPAPAGLIIGIHLYKETLSQVGQVPSEWGWFVSSMAFIFAAAGCVGMIGAEITAYKQAGIALAENQKGAAVIAVLAGFVCSAFVIWAVWTGDSARAVVGSVIVSIMGYVALASRDFLARRRGVMQNTETSADKDKAFTLAMEKQKTAQEQAAARKAKAESVQAAPVQAVHANKTVNKAFTPEKIAEIREYQAAHPNDGVREVAAACGVSVGSVVKYGIKSGTGAAKI